MERLATAQLQEWKRQPLRKPLLIDGARQVGKSYLVEQLFGKGFERVVTLDFAIEPDLAEMFAGSLDPQVIIENIEIRFGISIDLTKDLIFLDEIGECQPALDSLKYFSENLPEAFVSASGSNIGLLGSFPVGKVQLVELFPLSFAEFLWASASPQLVDAYNAKDMRVATHSSLWKYLLEYYFVGGMPEAVNLWAQTDQEINSRIAGVTEIHSQLIAGYSRDFGKYNGKVNAQHIDSVFRSVPKQLANNVDDSVKRFRFKDVVANKTRYNDLRGPIDWLEKSKLVSKCYPIGSKPRPPLSVLAQDNFFKLFFFDVGLLGYLLEMTYVDQLAQKINYKGYIAENFVQNEYRAHISYPTYSWEQGESQIEFLHRGSSGEVIPVEVKSGSRTRARSLNSYIKRYGPAKSVKLIGSSGSSERQDMLVWPLYYTQYLNDL